MQKRIKKINWNRKKIITLSIVSVLVVVIVAGVFVFTKNNASKSASTATQRTVEVSKGNIEVSITGSGTVTSANTSDLMSNVEGKITKAYFEEGDAVKKGDLLYEIDDNDAQLSIQKIENSISQAQLSVSSNQKSYSNLTITAPFSGKVSDIKAEEGESASNGMSVFTITETSKLTLAVPFSTTYIPNIKVGQKVKVNLGQFTDIIDGVVTEIGNNTYTASNGGIVKDVKVTVNNPGTLTDESTGSVHLTTSDGTELESTEGTFEYASKKTVTTSTSGTFSSVNIEENQQVKKGDVLIRIENDDLQVTSETNDLKVQDLENQLTAAKKTLEDYKVYAPFDGTISAVTAVQGDSLERGDALLSIRDFNQMEFDISVDELDISKVEVGQEASITIDALTETEKTPLTGEVIYKAMEGTSENGVATYPVTIKINETDSLLAGMNANATIILQKAENVLELPLEAVTTMGEKSFVWVKGTSDSNTQQAQASNKLNTAKESAQSSTSVVASNSGRGNKTTGQSADSSTKSNRMPPTYTQNKEYYATATMKEVEIGINSDEYIEIKSGLSEGDQVILPPLAEASTGESSTSSKSSSGFNMGGVAGGGMSGGMGGGQGGPPNR